MRTIITFFFVIFLTLYTGCSNDNSTGNNNNPPATRDSLIVSFDSLTVTNYVAPYHNGFGFGDTLTVKNFRVSFSVTANLDTTTGSFLNFQSFHNGDTVNYFVYSKTNTSLNNLSVNVTFSHDVVNSYYFSSNIDFGFLLGFPMNPERYIKVESFKLFALLN